MCLGFTITYRRKTGDSRYQIHPHSSSLEIFKRNLDMILNGVLDNITWVFLYNRGITVLTILIYYVQLHHSSKVWQVKIVACSAMKHDPEFVAGNQGAGWQKGCRAFLVITLTLFFSKLLFSCPIVSPLLEPGQYSWF